MTDYKKCKQAANQLLLMQDELPPNINLHHLTHDKTITITSFIDYCRTIHANTGKFFKEFHRGINIYDSQNDIYIILFSDAIKDYRSIRWLIAHEIGHIYLNHHSEHSANDEAEANYFARQLLTPSISLLKIITDYGVRNPEALAAIFEVPISAINYHLKAIKKMNGIYVDSTDKIIWEKQEEHVLERIRYADSFYSLSV